MRRLKNTVKPFLALVVNEWRDVRALTVVCLILVPIAQLVIDLGFLDWRGDFAGSVFVPSVIALYIAVIASDIVAAEVAGGRAKTYASLPVRASTRWLAKITFLVLAGAGFAIWTYGVTATLYAAFAPEPRQVAAFHESLGRIDDLWIIGGIAVIAAIVLWSTVLERGMAAIGAAFVTAAVIGGTVPLLAMHDKELLPSKDALETAALVLPLVFLAASYVAFVRGPVHAGTLLRRGALACATLAAILVPAGTVWGATLLDRLDVEPGDPDVHVALVAVSPDGEHALVCASKRHAYARNRAWVLDVQSGRMAPLFGKGYDLGNSGWTDEGTLVLWTDGKDSVRREFDLADGHVIRTRSLEQIQAEGEDPRLGGPRRWWTKLRPIGAEWHVDLPDGRTITVPRNSSFSAIPGLAFRHEGDTLVLQNVLDHTTRSVRLPERIAGSYASPRGRYVSAWSANSRWMIDAVTGEIVLEGSNRWYGWIGGGSSDRYVMSWTPGEREIVDLETGEHLPIPEALQDTTATIRFIGPRVCLLADDEHRITLHDLEKGTARILYEPR